jgi:hypothetical protein
MDCLRPQVEEWETPILLRPLETVNLFHISEIPRSNCKRETGYRTYVFLNFLQSLQATERHLNIFSRISSYVANNKGFWIR